MAKHRGGGAQLIWTLEYYDWAKRIERDKKVLTRMSIRHTPRKAILDVYVEVWSVVGNEPHTKLVREGIFWPNENTASFDTQVMGLLGSVEARLEEALARFKLQSHLL